MTKNDIIAYCVKNQNNININILSGMLDSYVETSIIVGTANANADRKSIISGKSAYVAGKKLDGILYLPSERPGEVWVTANDIPEGKIALVKVADAAYAILGRNANLLGLENNEELIEE